MDHTATAAERLEARLAEAEAVRLADGGGAGLEAILARVSAEATREAQERRAGAGGGRTVPRPYFAPMKLP